AVAGYREALAAAPEGWASYTRCVEALLFSLSSLDSNQAVIDFARAVMPNVRASSTYISAAGSALGSAIALPDANPNKKATVEEFEANLREGLSDGSIQMSYDDR